MIIGSGSIGTRKPEVSYRGFLSDPTPNQRTYSTTIDLGTAHPSRLIIVQAACITGSTEQPTTCTVDGASATLAVGNSVAGVLSVPEQVWYVARPTGGSVTVSISKPGGADMDGGSFAVYAAYYLKSQTPRATNQTAVSADPSSVPLTVLANSLVFAGAAVSNTIATTWTASGVTIDISRNVPDFQWAFGSASQVSGGVRPIGFGGVSNNAVSAYWR